MKARIETKDWRAWIDLMPPKPDDLHVTGRVYAPTPMHTARLIKREPQGINPTILQLQIFLEQQGGSSPDVMTWIEARYDETLTDSSIKITTVEIFADESSIARIEVSEVH